METTYEQINKDMVLVQSSITAAIQRGTISIDDSIMVLDSWRRLKELVLVGWMTNEQIIQITEVDK